jgi:hypothetical protein
VNEKVSDIIGRIQTIKMWISFIQYYWHLLPDELPIIEIVNRIESTKQIGGSYENIKV